MADRLRDQLVIFRDGAETAGLTVYGLYSASSQLPVVTAVAATWGEAPITSTVLHGHSWRVLLWDVPVSRWGTREQFTRSLRDTMTAHLRAGARVAWVAAEGLPYADPPDLFDPTYMSGGVLAWMTSTSHSCPVDPEQPMQLIADQELEQLRHHAAGLADTS